MAAHPLDRPVGSDKSYLVLQEQRRLAKLKTPQADEPLKSSKTGYSATRLKKSVIPAAQVAEDEFLVLPEVRRRHESQ